MSDNDVISSLHFTVKYTVHLVKMRFQQKEYFQRSRETVFFELKILVQNLAKILWKF